MPTRRSCAIWSGSQLPHGTPARLVALVLLGGLAVASAHAAPERKGAPPACQFEPFASGMATTVVDGRTFVLADGREVRVAGIEVPPLPGTDHAKNDQLSVNAEPGAQPSGDSGVAAAAALRALVVGNEAVLKHAKPAADRYGRLLADVFVLRDGVETSVARTLVAQGLARVAARPGEPACTGELRAAERTARAAKLGVWADPRYFSKQAEDVAEISAERGRFTLVEGKVVSVRESGGTIYVNFGRRWQQDFTVTILKRNERLFTAAGLEPRSLTGRRVMVRGWIEERGGPWIEASGPEQIEIVADK
jgi:endonuclease YncB( thermonuclease family)